MAAGNPTVFPGDIVMGAGTAQISTPNLYVGNPFITDRLIQTVTGAGNGIQASKLIHQFSKIYVNSPNGSNVVTEKRILHVVYGLSATFLSVQAGAVLPLTGNDTCTIDVINASNVSYLTSTIALSSGDSAYGVRAGTFATTALTTGNVIVVNVQATHNTGTLPQGVFVQIIVREDAQ